MRFSLKQLVVITCLALGGIISLQIFWLVKTYAEKKSQLKTTVSNTMVETQAFTGVTPILSNSIKIIANNIADSINELNIGDSGIRVVNKKYSISGGSGAVAITDSSPEDKMLRVFLEERGMGKEYSIGSYKEQLKQALVYKGITMPFHLALFGDDNEIIACTTDSLTFLNATEKTDKGYSFPVKLKGHPAGQLQMALPGLSIYLLKDMALILVSAVFLIIICCFSFYGMIKMFFREKKLADIRNDFMNNMTHELRTPISSASLALELLQDTSVGMSEAARQDYIQVAESELKRLSMLVDKVLKMAAFERTEVILHKDLFPVAPWLQHMLDALRPLTDRQQVMVRTTIDPPEIYVWADQEYLSGLIQNLLENAIKYRDKGKAQTFIDIDISHSDTHCIIQVKDNGAGIPRAYLDKIFDKFFRVPTGDRHDSKGYGLGLSYVYEIVKLHNGTITVTSEEKAGTSFEIKLPGKTGAC